MEIREFTEKLKEEIRNYLPDDVCKDVEIGDATVVKMNDQKLYGLMLRMPGSDAAPTLYVNDMYEAYKEGADIGYLASEMANMYTQTKDAPRPPEVDLSFESIKDKLTVRLLEKKRNREFLSNMPYASVGHGLALTADINFGEDRGGDWRIAVNRSLLESMEIDSGTLFVEAIKNSPNVDPPVLIDMSNALFEPERVNLLERTEPIAPEDLGGMYVLTNESGTLGAAALFNPNVMERAGELLDSDYYILPSSIHETILVPDTPAVNAKDLTEMVKQANRSVVDEKDILSDSVYHYSKDTRAFDKVSDDRNRADMVAERG